MAEGVKRSAGREMQRGRRVGLGDVVDVADAWHVWSKSLRASSRDGLISRAAILNCHVKAKKGGNGNRRGFPGWNCTSGKWKEPVDLARGRCQ